MGRSTFDDALEEIDRGREGLNTGVDFGLTKLSSFIPNIQPKKFTTLAMGSGVGKTSMALYSYIYSPYEHMLKEPDIDYKCIFYTMEIDKVSVLLKLISLKLFKDHKLVVPPDIIATRNAKNRLNDELYKLISGYRGYFERLDDMVEFIEEPTNPTGISKKVQEVMMGEGYLIYFDENGLECSKENAKRSKYIPNNPKAVRNFMLDHSDCIKQEKDATTSKAKIDLFCEKAVYGRNRFGASFTVLSQLNRSLDNAERNMHGKSEKNRNYDLLLPQASDLKGTGNLYESSDYVIYGFAPHNYGIKEFMGYDVERLKDRVRIIGIMKNRWGASNIAAGYGYLGESSLFFEIPRPDLMTDDMYNRITNLK